MESTVSNPTSPTPPQEAVDPTSVAFAAHSHPNDEYRKVKMKYFMSLGMNKPPRSASEPAEPGKPKERTRTMPGANVMPSASNEEWESASSLEDSLGLETGSARQRSLSTPPITIQRMPVLPTHEIPIPTNLTSPRNPHWKTESPDSGSSVGSASSQDDEEFEKFSHKKNRKKEFIPPHILAQQRDASAPFQVGTAHSVTLWEQARRKKHSNV